MFTPEQAVQVIQRQAREITALRAALMPFAVKVRANDFDLAGLARFGVSGRASNDDYRAAYAALNVAQEEK